MARTWIQFKKRDHVIRRLAVLMVLSGGYFLFIIAASSLTELDRVPYRYFSVVFIPAICLVFALIDHATQSGRGAGVFRWLSRGTCLLWSIIGLPMFYLLLLAAALGGAGGYSSTIWRHSPVMAYLKGHPLQGTVFSNGPDAIYILNHQKANKSPGNDDPRLKACRDERDGRPLYLVWFNTLNWRTYLATPQRLARDHHLNIQRRFKDGTIYTIECRGPF